MPPLHSEITEIFTGLGTLFETIDDALAAMPTELVFVSEETWKRICDAYRQERDRRLFTASFQNGQALYQASEGLRNRRPLLIEWKGPHRPPGDDTIPADLRIDHVYLVSCKYISKVLLNPSPHRLFRGLLLNEERSTENWFAVTAPEAFQRFYEATLYHLDLSHFPTDPVALTKEHKRHLKSALSDRQLPNETLRSQWQDLCSVVSNESAHIWSSRLTSSALQLRLLWRMLRIGGASYFVLGVDRRNHLRFRVSSTWDWTQRFELTALTVAPGSAGQPEVKWRATIVERRTNHSSIINGHIEIRWSHGRFAGAPEAKVYLDSPLETVPGYERLT